MSLVKNSVEKDEASSKGEKREGGRKQGERSIGMREEGKVKWGWGVG